MIRLFPNAAFGVLAVVLAAPDMRADYTCHNSDFRGVYGALALGDFIVTPPGIPPGPTARIGRVTTDGNGNSTIQATLALSGAIFKEDYGGVYTVNPDCSVTVTLLIPFPGAPQPIPFKFTGMLADDGREMHIILVDPPGSTVRIMLRKQPKDDCTSHDLAGGYVLNMSGVNVFQQATPLGLFGRVGKVKFDGVGAFTFAGTASYGGRVGSETFSGVYSIDLSCNLTMTYTVESNILFHDPWRFTLSGILTDYSSAGNLIVSEPQGAVITGTLKRQ